MPSLFHLSAILGSGLHWPTLSDVSYQAAGMLVVMAALCTLAIAVSLAGRALRSPASSRDCPPPQDLQPSHPANAGEIPDEIRTIIAAAVAATLDQPHHIVNIRAEESIWLQAWSAEGRREIFQSHQFR